MNPQKELQQMQDLSLKLDIPIWKNSIELPFRDKKVYHYSNIKTFAISHLGLKTMGLKTINLIIFISTQELRLKSCSTALF